MKKVLMSAICLGITLVMGACGSGNKAESLYKDMDAITTAQKAVDTYLDELKYYEAVTETKVDGKVTEIITEKINMDTKQSVSETQLKNCGSNYGYSGNIAHYTVVTEKDNKILKKNDYQIIIDEKGVVDKYIFKTKEKIHENSFNGLDGFKLYYSFKTEQMERKDEGDSIILHEGDNGRTFDIYIGKDGYIQKMVVKSKEKRYSKYQITSKTIDIEKTVTFIHRNDEPDMEDLLKKAEVAFKAHEKETPAYIYMSKEETRNLKDGDQITKLPDIDTMIQTGKFYDINIDGTIKIFPLTGYYLLDKFTIQYDDRPITIMDATENKIIDKAMRKYNGFEEALQRSLPNSRIDFKDGKWY